MDRQNQTVVTEILLLGFTMLREFRILTFLLFLIMYVMTLGGNLMIIILVSLSHHLHSPMYFFLGHLSLTDILLTTNTVPNMLNVLLKQESTIPLSGCITQLNFFGIALSSECLLLTVMSYDRYLAICKPLHYASIMNNHLPLQLAAGSWFTSSLTSMATAIVLSKLQFCGSNIIDHFYCDFSSLLELSCSDTSVVKVINLLQAGPLTIFPIVLITTSYVHIFHTILKIPSTNGIQKAFSTCSSHLTVVCIFFVTLFIVYVVPSKGYSLIVSKILSMLHTVVTPLLNPIIYSMRNKEIKTALKKYIVVKSVNKMLTDNI